MVDFSRDNGYTFNICDTAEQGCFNTPAPSQSSPRRTVMAYTPLYFICAEKFKRCYALEFGGVG